MIVVGIGLIGYMGRDTWMAGASAGEETRQVEGVIRDHWTKEQTRTVNDQARVETIEHFRVRDIDFQFAQTNLQRSYFTNAAEKPVKLQNGMQLRIAYIESGDTNKIVKLEVAH